MRLLLLELGATARFYPYFWKVTATTTLFWNFNVFTVYDFIQYTLNMHNVNVPVNYKIYRCICITDRAGSQDDWILAKFTVILLPLHVNVCPASLTQKNSQRHKIIHCGMRPMGRKD